MFITKKKKKKYLPKLLSIQTFIFIERLYATLLKSPKN